MALPELARRHGIRLLVLFGSTVTGRRHPESDLDLAVLFDREPEDETWLSEEAALQAELETTLRPSCPLQLVVMNGADASIQNTVANEGILLYVADPLDWTWFQIRAHRQYEDTAKYRWRRHQRTLAIYGVPQR